MKANQAFKANEDAVSPVIGVILMVAITVVLAAVVFVLVGNLTDTSEAAPTATFIKDEQGTAAGGILTLQSVQNGPIALDNFRIGGGITETNCDYNGETFQADGTLSAASITALGATNMAAGDQISCTDAATITVSVIDPAALLYSGEFGGT